jgi:hypothetical protein
MKDVPENIILDIWTCGLVLDEYCCIYVLSQHPLVTSLKPVKWEVSQHSILKCYDTCALAHNPKLEDTETTVNILYIHLSTIHPAIVTSVFFNPRRNQAVLIRRVSKLNPHMLV